MDFPHGDFVVMSDNSLGGNSMVNVSHFSNDSSVSLVQSVESTDDVVGMRESVLLHNMEQSVDHMVGMNGSMSDDRMKLINKSMVGNDGVHLVLVHFHTTF